MRPNSAIQKTVPLDIAGANSFGRYPKISIEQTFNLFLSDGWMVPFAGYQVKAPIAPSGIGRTIYASEHLNKMIAVIDNGVYLVSTFLSYQKIGVIDSFEGDVFIAENNASQIAICDKKDIWIFNYSANTFLQATIDFVPGYIEFQDGYFIAAVTGQAAWRLSNPNDGTAWPTTTPGGGSNVGTFQTKPNSCVACVKVPGKGNLLMVFGNTVTEPWYDVGAQLFPYQKNSYYNIDYGCINAATIAVNDTYVAWVGINEKSGPVIMYSDGGPAHQISDDGMNFRLAHLTNPTNCFGSMVKQDGHTFYQVSWPDDNLTYTYDFNTNKFYTLTDQYMSTHIAKKYVSFNNTFYFVSFSDGNIYESNSLFTDFNGNEIPRVRVTKPFRLADSSRFVANSLTFTIEQGQEPSIQRVDASICRNGGESFGSYVRYDLNAPGRYMNRLTWWNLGQANDMVFQFRFWGHSRFVATDGLVSISQ